MKNYCLISVILIGLISWSPALVHYKKVEKGTNGCKVGDTELEVGGVVQDPEVCGVYACQNKEGDTLIHYCQIPIPPAQCKSDGVLTTLDFPECCWHCTKYVIC